MLDRIVHVAFAVKIEFDPALAGLPIAGERREPWSWFERGRGATPYQPIDDDPHTRDANGCRAKLAMVREAALDWTDAAVVSLGAHSGYYEYHIARNVPRLRALHLVDTSAAALTAARERCGGLAVADFQTFECAADHFAFPIRYDVCLLLSVWHHYDRLGPVFRRRGIDLLRTIGRSCRTLIFETGQSDDPRRDTEAWPSYLDMAAAPSPATWIESHIPEWTGYGAWRCLGTNPVTNRLLYLFWHD